MQLTPINTYHLRSTYPIEKILRYVEWPRGLGLGRALTDEFGHRRELFGIVFEDSGGRLQYNVGYMRLWSWGIFGTDPDLVYGVGYMFLLMGRWDWNYIPIPFVLPVASLGIGSLSLETTFVPGWEGYGNVFFTWIQLRL